MYLINYSNNLNKNRFDHCKTCVRTISNFNIIQIQCNFIFLLNYGITLPQPQVIRIWTIYKVCKHTGKRATVLYFDLVSTCRL